MADRPPADAHRSSSSPTPAASPDAAASVELLRESEARFRATFEAAPVGMAHTSVGGEWLAVNSRLCEILGYQRDELLSLRFQALTHPADLTADLDGALRLLSGEARSYAMAKRYLRKDGSTVWTRLTRSLVRTGEGVPFYFLTVVEELSGSEREAAVRGATEAERLALALDGAEDGVWDWDVPTGRVHYSAHWFRMLGFQPDELAPSVQTWESLVHPDDAPRVLEVLRAHLDGVTPYYRTVHRLRRKDGTWAWILDRGKVVERDASGRPLRAVGTHTDVTSHEETAAALRASEARARVQLAELDAMYRSAPAGLGFLDRELRYVRVNDRLAAMNGRSAAEHLGRRVREIIPALAPQLEPLLQGIVATGVPVRDLEFRAAIPAAPGEERDWLVNYEPVLDGAKRVIGINVAVAEITTQKRVEAAHAAHLAREAAARLEAESARREAERDARRATLLGVAAGSFNAAATTGEVSGVLLRESRLALAADAALVALWREESNEVEIIDCSGFADVVTGYLRDSWRRFSMDVPVPITRALRTGTPVSFASEAERAALFPGTPATGYEAGLVQPLFSGGRRVGVLALSFAAQRVVSAEEHELLELLALQWGQSLDRARLFEAEREARREAEEARGAAEEANRVKSDFLAVMSHELRTPLNAIGGYVQLLEMGVRGPVTPQQHEDLARIGRAQQTLLGHIDNILGYARLQAGRLEYDIGPVAVADVVAELATLVGPQFQMKGLSYQVAIDADCVVRADRGKVTQVLLNLLSNALKFTPPGGTVTLGCAQRADGSGDPALVHLRVSDTGAGIPRDALEQVFEPFVQRRDTGSRHPGGTGLGLAISRELARGMGGDLRARSVPGAGSTFTLTLNRWRG